MQFSVQSKEGFKPQTLPQLLNPALSTFPSLPPPSNTRILTLNELKSGENPLGSFLNGQKWSAMTSETPQLGSTEEWSIVDLTDDAHPIHLHIAQFQIVFRQPINSTSYTEAWEALNGVPPVTAAKELEPAPFLIGPARLPESIEQCWKDTVIVLPGEVTVIRVRFSPQEVKDYPFDATTEPGYIWHCHILDHEDNEMMQRLKLVNGTDNNNNMLPNWLIAVIASLSIVLVIFVVVFTTYRCCSKASEYTRIANQDNEYTQIVDKA